MTDSRTVEGTLTWTRKRQALLSWVGPSGRSTTRPARAGSLDARLVPTSGKRVAVRIQLNDRNEPVHVLPLAAENLPSALARPPAAPSPPAGRRPPPEREPRVGGTFLNPYNFVPTPPRDGIPDGSELGDRDPVELGLHDRFPQDRLSGRIGLSLECRSPLLLLDSSRRAGRAAHWTYPVRIDPESPDDAPLPLLDATAVKGMLRAAFETITNSRYGVFGPHSRRLGRRQASERGKSVVPVRIDESGRARLLRGTTPTNREQPLHAAWIAMYGPGGQTRHRTGGELRHGQRACAWLRLVRRTKELPRGRTVPIDLWRVVEIDTDESRLSSECPSMPAIGREQYLDDRAPIKAWGWVCVTNRNIGTKHDERFLFDELGDLLLDVPPPVRERWSELIADALEANSARMERRNARGWEPTEYVNATEPALSWHLVDEEAGQLKAGTLAYADVGDGAVTALYPVSISRSLHEVAPGQLLHESLQPATERRRLSPADRVFGWVAPAGEGAWAGLLRVGRVSCKTPDSIRPFKTGNDAGLPLAILGAPKPHQGRFYLARDDSGAPLEDGIDASEAAYRPDRRLRGRKVYLHHAALDDAFWRRDPMATDQLSRRPYLEYRRPRSGSGEEQQDSQNRTIEGWVKPGTRFDFDLWFENLSEVELGALLWLASLEDGCHLRLGLGRPLGFGSVRLRRRDLEVETGAEREAWYRSLAAAPPVPVADPADRVASAMRAFESAVGAAYEREFAELTFIRGFLAAARGDARYPVHYPRSTPEPHTAGENFHWFVGNERQTSDRRARRWALPSILDGDPSLPIQGAPPGRGGRA